MELSLQLITKELKKTYPDAELSNNKNFNIRNVTILETNNYDVCPNTLYCINPLDIPQTASADLCFLFIDQKPDTSIFENYIFIPSENNIQQLFIRVQKILLKIWSWSAQILELSTSCSDYSHLIEECAAVIDVPFYYYSLYHNFFFGPNNAIELDSDFLNNYLECFYDPDLVPATDKYSILKKVHLSHESCCIYFDHSNSYRLIRNIFVDNMRIGSIGLFLESNDAKELYDPYLTILTICISNVFKTMMKQTQNPVRKWLVDYLSGEIVSSAQHNFPEELKKIPGANDSYRIFVLHPLEKSIKNFFSEQLLYINLLKRFLDTNTVFFHNGNIVVFCKYPENFNHAEYDATLAKLQYFSQKISSCIGISLPFLYLNKSKTFYEQAKSIALTENLQNNKTSMLNINNLGWPPIHDYSYYLLFDMIKHFSITHPLKYYIHPDIQLLAEQDDNGNNHLLQSLYLYLLNEKSYKICSEKQFVHRNTFAYRIKKALSYIKSDIDDENIRLSLLLSICMYWYLHPQTDPVGISKWHKK